jgi:hypothetical protein
VVCISFGGHSGSPQRVTASAAFAQGFVSTWPMKPTAGSFIDHPLFLQRWNGSWSGSRPRPQEIPSFRGDLEFAQAPVAEAASEHEPRYPSGMPSPTPRNVGMISGLAWRKFL